MADQVAEFPLDSQAERYRANRRAAFRAARQPDPVAKRRDLDFVTARSDLDGSDRTDGRTRAAPDTLL